MPQNEERTQVEHSKLQYIEVIKREHQLRWARGDRGMQDCFSSFKDS